MNTQRIIVLGFALVAAGGAAFLVRGMLGGGTPAVQAKAAPGNRDERSSRRQHQSHARPGAHRRTSALGEMAELRRSIRPSLPMMPAGNEEQSSRAPSCARLILPGQPITKTAIVHGDASGFMAATLERGMRAVSIADLHRLRRRRLHPAQRPRRRDPHPQARGQQAAASPRPFCRNLRVLAVDQTFKQEKDTSTVVGKTATVEVSPEQAEAIAAAAHVGRSCRWRLRPLSEATSPSATTPAPSKRAAAPMTAPSPSSATAWLDPATGRRPSSDVLPQNPSRFSRWRLIAPSAAFAAPAASRAGRSQRQGDDHLHQRRAPSISA